MRKKYEWKKARSISVILALLITAFVFNQGFGYKSSGNDFNISLSVNPHSTGNYVADFKVVDNDGNVITAPKLICVDSEKAVINIDGEYRFEAAVLIMEHTRSVDYSVKLSKKGVKVFEQDTSIKL
ncbi:MAG: hypothetical protein WC002_05135 [Candidatus Muiribacteriota bacterium]